MGAFQSLFKNLLGKKDLRVLIVGLGGAGKTTILSKLKLGENLSTAPVAGVDIKTVAYKNLSAVAWDVEGLDQVPADYWDNIQGMIFVVDSSGHESFAQAKQGLDRLLGMESLAGAAVVVFANKQDHANAMTRAEITNKLGLHTIRNRPWFVQATCATSGDGLYEGIDWLTTDLGRRRS